MTGQITLIFQYSLQGAPLQARRAACWGASGEEGLGQDHHAGKHSVPGGGILC